MLVFLSYLLFSAWCLATVAMVARVRASAHDGRGADHLSLSSSLDGDGHDDGGPPSHRRRVLTPDQREALEELTRPAMFERVLRWLERLGLPLRDREDVRQDAMLAMFRSIRTYDGRRARPERWMNRVVVHVAAHYFERAPHRREDLTANPPEGADTRPTADVVIELEERRGALLEALRELPEGPRAVVQAYDLEGEHMGTIAVRLGIPLSTAYKWRVRALDALMKALRPADG